MCIFKMRKWIPGSYRLSSSNSVSGKIMGHDLSESVSEHVKAKKVIRISEHGFTKDNSFVLSYFDLTVNHFTTEGNMDEERLL